MFIGYRDTKILFVSSSPCLSDDCEIIEWIDPDIEGKPAAQIIHDYEVWRGKVVERAACKPIGQLRLALVGVYRIQCGIATYAEQLFPRFAEAVEECRIFAEVASEAPEEDNVERCWMRGEPLTELTKRIHAFRPDVVYVEHEFGIFPNARHWLAFISQMSGYRVFVKQHSIFYHKDKLVCESAIPNIIVHSQIGKKVLKEKGVPSEVHVIPHGCFPCTNTERLWNLYHSPHTLVQFGFGFEYKGWENALKAVAKLKESYPQVFYTGLFSESKFNRVYHDNYYDRLMELVRELGIEGQVALIRGYQSDESLDAYLRTNQVAVFPYVRNGEHTVYGVTGAARLAMATGTPTIASDVPQFDDLEGVCPRPATVDDIVAEVSTLFNSKEARTALVARQNAFLEETSWDRVAKAHLDLMSGVKE